MRRRITGAERRARAACLAGLVVFALPAVAPAAAGTLHSTYIDPEALALQRVLPPPPEADSEMQRADLRAVEAAVGARTPDDERRTCPARSTASPRFLDRPSRHGRCPSPPR